MLWAVENARHGDKTFGWEFVSQSVIQFKIPYEMFQPQAQFEMNLLRVVQANEKKF